MLQLKLEVRAYVRVRVEQLFEGAAIQPQGENVVAGAHGRLTRPAVDQLDLAEGVAGVKGLQRNVVAGLRALDDTRTAADENIDPVGRLAFGGKDASERERHRHEPPHDLRSCVVWKKPKYWEIVEDARFSHPASAGRPTPASGRRIAQAVRPSRAA
jgi:hypothetical protein